MTEPVSTYERRTLPAAAYAGSLALLLALAGGAWILTARRKEELGAGGGMAGMDAGAALSGLGSFCLTWLLMMAAMMVPSVAPRALDSARLAGADRALPSLRQAVAIIGFLAGYLLAWLAAGLVAYAVVDGARWLDGGFALDGLSAT